MSDSKSVKSAGKRRLSLEPCSAWVDVEPAMVAVTTSQQRLIIEMLALKERLSEEMALLKERLARLT